MPFQKGHKLAKGRKPLSVEMNFFKKLDNSLPDVVDYCIYTIKKALEADKLNLKLMSPIEIAAWVKTHKELHDLAMKAAQILMSKAPQRIQGSGDDGEFIFKIASAGNYKI